MPPTVRPPRAGPGPRRPLARAASSSTGRPARPPTGPPFPLDADDTDLFVRFADAGRYRSPVTPELRRRGYLLAPGVPRPRYAAPMAAFAQTLAAWTLGVATPTGHSDTLVCFGRRHTAVLDREPGGTSVVSMRALHTVPLLLADRMDLGPRPLLSGELVVPRITTIDHPGGPEATLARWAAAAAGTWPAVAAHVRDGRWRLVRLHRRWFDGEPRADRLLLLDTPAGYARVVQDDHPAPGCRRPEGPVALLRPMSSADVWTHVCGGPRPHPLLFESAQRWFLRRGHPGLARNLRGWLFARREPPHPPPGVTSPAWSPSPTPGGDFTRRESLTQPRG